MTTPRSSRRPNVGHPSGGQVRFRLIALCCILSSCASAQTTALRARLSQLDITQCRQGKSTSYQMYVSTRFEVTNESTMAVLVSKEVEMIPAVRVAASGKDAKQGKYLFTIESDYFVSERQEREPRLDDFLTLEPGRGRSLSVRRKSLLASTVPRPGSSVLTQATYWVQFQLWTLPQYFWLNHGDVKKFRRKWKSQGYLTDQHVWTEPFPIEVKLLPNARSCQW